MRGYDETKRRMLVYTRDKLRFFTKFYFPIREVDCSLKSIFLKLKTSSFFVMAWIRLPSDTASYSQHHRCGSIKVARHTKVSRHAAYYELVIF